MGNILLEDGRVINYLDFEMSKKTSKKVVISEEQREKEELQIMKKLYGCRDSATPPTSRTKSTSCANNSPTCRLGATQHQAEDQDRGRNGQEQRQVRTPPATQMRESFEIEKTIKIQEEELTDLENNYKLLRNTFEEARKKLRAEWEAEAEQLARRKAQEKENAQRSLALLAKKIDFLKQFKVPAA